MVPVQIVVEADGSVVDDGTDLESIPEGLCLMSIYEGEDADAASAAAPAQEKSDEELVRLIEVQFPRPLTPRDHPGVLAPLYSDPV